jgi:hypothetical protein
MVTDAPARGLRLLGLALIVAAVSAIPALASGCVTQSASEVRFPSKESFVTGNVSEFLELRCGAMDCHGQVGRPLRLYGQYGLRMKATGAERGTEATTDAERSANYNAVVGLEPEDLSFSFQTGGEFTDFLLFKKPLDERGGGVKHKGGPVLTDSDADPGWVCLRSWVRNRVQADKCKQAANVTQNRTE